MLLGLPWPFRTLFARMLDGRVRAREHQARVTVVEPHQVRRLPARPPDLDDLARPLRLAHDIAPHVEPVPDACLHPPPPHPGSRATHAPETAHTSVGHLTTTSIHLHADGSSQRRPPRDKRQSL